MAQLKDSVVTGNLRVTNKILTDSLQTIQTKAAALTGTGTVGSTDGSTYYPSKWTFDTGVALQDNNIITIIVPVAGHSNGVYISVDNGTTYKPVVLNGTTILTTHYVAGMPMVLIYDEDASTGSMAPVNGGAKAAQTGGAWRFLNFYDANNNVTQSIKTDNTNRPLLMANYAVGSTSTSATSTNRAQAIYANASTGTITASKVNTKAIIAQTGSGTAGQDKGSGVSPRYIPSLWTFNSDITVTNGEIYFIKIPVAGGTYGVWLSLNNGTNYYPVAVSGSSTARFTNHYGANTVIAVTYESAGVCNCYAKTGGDSLSEVTGIFRVLNDFDADTKNTAGSTNSTSKLYLIGAASQGASSQTYSHSQIYETDGTLYLIKTTDASGTVNYKPALIVGGTDTSTHLEFDANEIMAKANGTTPSTLYLNKDGGVVNIGSGGLNISGELVLATENTSAEIYDEIVDITVSDPNNDYKGQLELVEGSATIRGDGPSNKYCYISANYDGISIGCYDGGSQGYTINSQGIYQGSTNIYDVISDVAEQIAPVYNTSTTYSLGDYCIGFDDKFYRYTSSTPSSGEGFDPAKWTQTTVAAELGNINSILEEVL